MQIAYPVIEVANGDENFLMLLQAGGLSADITSGGEKIIYVLAGYRKHLPVHVAEFAICHEAAHLDLDHLTGLDPAVLYDLPKFELEADARAVSHYGCVKGALADMLSVLPKALTATLAEQGVVIDLKLLEAAVVEMRVKHAQRLAALED